MPDAWEHTTYRQGVTLIYIARRKLLCRKRWTSESQERTVRGRVVHRYLLRLLQVERVFQFAQLSVVDRGQFADGEGVD
jgi:hypothetical protein